jgi:hypothetical protein
MHVFDTYMRLSHVLLCTSQIEQRCAITSECSQRDVHTPQMAVEDAYSTTAVSKKISRSYALTDTSWR